MHEFAMQRNTAAARLQSPAWPVLCGQSCSCSLQHARGVNGRAAAITYSSTRYFLFPAANFRLQFFAFRWWISNLWCYDTVLYDTVLYIMMYVCLYCVILIIIILVWFMLSVVQFTVCLLAHLPYVCLAKLWSTERPWKFRSRAWFESYWQYVVWTRTVELCRDCASTRCGTFPQVYRGTGTLLFKAGHLLWACHVDVNVVAHRWTSSRGVFHRRGRWCSTRTISSTITGSFVKRQRKRPGRTVSSDQVVSSHLISVAERGHAVRTFHRVTCHRSSSKSECVDPRRKIVSRR